MTSALPLHRRLNTLPDVEALLDEPMARHTTYRIGGPARHYVVAHSLDALQATLWALRSVSVPFILLGNGSNVLFADAGYAGAVVSLGTGLQRWTLERDALGAGAHLLEVGAGLSVTRLLRVTKREGLEGLERLGGVPATIGGAVRMNAGTKLGEVKDCLVAAQVVSALAAPEWLGPEDLGLAYRRSALPPGAVVTAARFRVRDAADDRMRARLDEVLAYRRSTQPLNLPSCGSVFANPQGDAAGRLIEAAGLKGRRVGGAQISERHANWIVNVDGARAADVKALIDLCIAEVEARFDVTLRPEVQLLGDWQEVG